MGERQARHWSAPERRGVKQATLSHPDRGAGPPAGGGHQAAATIVLFHTDSRHGPGQATALWGPEASPAVEWTCLPALTVSHFTPPPSCLPHSVFPSALLVELT